jgi:hypothetical protein
VLLPITGHVAAHVPPSVDLKSACPHTFLIARAGRATRWFRGKGYVVPILSHDRAFDEQWSVEADDREFAEALVRQREVRAAIGALAALDCHALRQGRRQLSALLGEWPKGEERERHERAVREQLAAIAAAIARLGRLRSFPHQSGRGRIVVASIALGLAFAAGIAGLAIGAGELIGGALGRLGLQSLLLSVPLVLGLGALAVLRLAGRSTSHKDLALVLLLMLVALPAFGVGATVFANRALDGGPPTVRRLPVLELREHHAAKRRGACTSGTRWPRGPCPARAG